MLGDAEGHLVHIPSVSEENLNTYAPLLTMILSKILFYNTYICIFR